ncbi:MULTISPECIES: bifunctional biotin--[acetyl-CoA-carboxylase] ligase/biotin operon repressor BirA [unclassified Gilliamella]|uniref:bifunctional biotin--[acetyl-CoA-carboxylase] ligase/biotin operon repressor BirA n=1 Tax=unclassified Gilliamella TaxID=2685620 RepID=UPI00226A7454|nr:MULTISPECIES: bifunctional biotin--[acetyl-CoA-carboxylase] ligase/biotin operon repressor BirA [unclassified Gilliamella]MCX8574790.1 bifunctional biotin--[acetyl-CoA-carboxylase] ligase/biotin operon repressor BirA [Gilliamella sp. B3831]MCX8576856.1 bifunctional biotin--[acetyl-CoA-carboxylase] ligase/biotin operon repressor BirA [Gilliamella sp. B3815]MCX8589004.1 bifunctional biotin--[acetyl-CoA-carboxylase] ligase/biotin operon repressor BirA [Gilliamella sp. B3801]MCX8590514.1 bifunct
MRSYQNPLKLIEILADGNFHSGEELASDFGITRAGINKYIKVLREWGIELSSIQGKGYSLKIPMDLFNKSKIDQYYQADSRVEILPIIDSTNQYMLDKIPDLKSGDCCIAEFQSKARGRRGRQWFSPFGTNLYFSMYWRLEQGIAAAMGLSLVVGIVVTQALRELSGQDIKVKWPNDLYLNDQKLAGILVELAGKTGDCAHVVIGIGVNLNMTNPDPNIVNQKWANLGNINRNLLVAKIAKTLRENLEKFEKNGLAFFIDDWNHLDNFIHRPVKLLIGDDVIRGVAKGINDQGALLLEQNGKIQAYIGGEISLRSDE